MAEIIEDIYRLDVDPQSEDRIEDLINTVSELERAVDGQDKTSDAFKRNQEKLRAASSKLDKVLNQETKTIAGLRKQVKLLETVQERTERGTEDFERATRRLRTEQLRLDRATQNTTRSTSTLERTLRRGVGAIAVVATFDQAVEAGQRLVTINGDIGEAQNAVRRTTQQSKEEVRALTEEIQKFDSRTNLLGRLEIARFGGQFGIAQEELADFVREVDRAVVSLGDDFPGGAEAAIGTLARINDITGTADQFGAADGIRRIGSAVNFLTAQGTATAPVISDVTQRIGAIAKTANLSAPDILGIGAAIEESAQGAEVGSTAIIQLLGAAAKETEKFAKIAGVSTKEFEKILNTNGNEALLLILKGLRDNNKSATDFARSLDGLGLDGTRVSSVIQALTGNLDVLETRQRQANEQFDLGTSLLEEFNTQNTGSRAEIEKLGNSITQKLVNSDFDDFLAESAQSLRLVVESSGDWFQALKLTAQILTPIVSAVTAYQATLLGARAATVAITVAERARVVGIGLYRAAQLALTGNIRGAIVAVRALNVALLANPYALAIAGVVALGTALAVIVSRYNQASAGARALADVNREVNSQVRTQTTELEILVEQLKETNAGTEERRRIVGLIQQQYPDFLKNIDAENASVETLTSTYDDYIKSLRQQLRLEVVREKLRENTRKQFELEQKAIEVAQSSGGAGGLSLDPLNLIKQFRISQVESDAGDLQEAQSVLEKELNDLLKSINPDPVEVPVTPTAGGSGSPTGGPSSPGSSGDDKKAVDALAGSIDFYRQKVQEARAALDAANLSTEQAQQLADKLNEAEQKLADAEKLRQELRGLTNQQQSESNSQLEDAIALVTEYEKKIRDFTGTEEELRKVTQEYNAALRERNRLQEQSDQRLESAAIDELPSQQAPESIQPSESTDPLDDLGNQLQQRSNEIKIDEILSKEDQQELEGRASRILLNIVQIADAATQAVNQVFDALIQGIDNDISAQENAVNRLSELAKEGNAEILAQEEEKLNELQRKREDFVRAQRALDAIAAASNIVVAVTRVAAESGIFSAAGIATLLGAIATGVTAGLGLVNFAADGDPFVQGPGTSTSDSIPYMLSRGERVETAANNKKYWTTLQEGVHKNRVPPDVLNGFVSDYISGSKAPVSAVALGAAGQVKVQVNAKDPELNKNIKRLTNQLEIQELNRNEAPKAGHWKRKRRNR